jgi:hypothetical protein
LRLFYRKDHSTWAALMEAVPRSASIDFFQTEIPRGESGPRTQHFNRPDFYLFEGLLLTRGCIGLARATKVRNPPLVTDAASRAKDSFALAAVIWRFYSDDNLSC